MIKNKVGLVALSAVLCMLSFGSVFAKTWQCTTKCTGQFQSNRGQAHTEVDAISYSQAIDKAREHFNESCKVYHFYNSGGGEASPSYISCE